MVVSDWDAEVVLAGGVDAVSVHDAAAPTVVMVRVHGVVVVVGVTVVALTTVVVGVATETVEV